MDLLGFIIEGRSGRRLGTHLHECIFGPLGMRDSWFGVPAEHEGGGPGGGARRGLHDAHAPSETAMRRTHQMVRTGVYQALID